MIFMSVSRVFLRVFLRLVFTACLRSHILPPSNVGQHMCLRIWLNLDILPINNTIQLNAQINIFVLQNLVIRKLEDHPGI